MDTAVVWRDLRVVLKEAGGIVPLERYGSIAGRKRDWRVCFLFQGPEGEVTVTWDGWEGTRERARNWEDRRERWESTGRTPVSA